MSRPLLDDDPRQIGGWRLTARLGEGGFGVVYAGVRSDWQRGAVKVMHRHLAREADYVARFGREVALAQRVRGEHVANVLDYDLDASPPYLVTEYVSGPTLHEEVSLRGPLSGDNLYALALALAEAISSIAGSGVIHRDLKPGNVLLTARTPVVVDFGIASAVGLDRLTATGLVMGTGPYMAPEQFTGTGASPAIDVFAWGSVLHFAATGRAPFHDESGNASAVMYQVLHTDADHSTLPAPLAELARWAHAKEPGDRPTATTLVARLVALREPAADDPVRTSVMLVERTWHLIPTPPPSPPPSPPTPVAPSPGPAQAPGPSTPGAPLVLRLPPEPEPPNVVYTPPPAPPPARPQPRPQARPQTRPQVPPPARPVAPAPVVPAPPPPRPATPARYPGTWLARWAQRLPDVGWVGTLSALVYLVTVLAYDKVDDGVIPQGVEETRVVDAWNVAWALWPIVAFLALAFAAQRITRAVVARQGLTRAGWRTYAAFSSLLGLCLSLVPIPATVALVYGVAVLEPHGVLARDEAVVAGAGAAAMGLLAIVGLVFAVRALIHLGRSLVGTVVWRG